MNHADVGPRIARDNAVRLEGDEPALVSALGRDLLPFEPVLREIAIGEFLQVQEDQHVGPQVPVGKDWKLLADLGPERFHLEADALVVLFHAAVGDVEVVDELVREGMTDYPPVADIVVSLLVEPQVSSEIVEVGLGERLSVLVHVHVGIGQFTLGVMTGHVQMPHMVGSSVLVPYTKFDPSWYGRDRSTAYANWRRSFSNRAVIWCWTSSWTISYFVFFLVLGISKVSAWI